MHACMHVQLRNSYFFPCNFLSHKLTDSFSRRWHGLIKVNEKKKEEATNITHSPQFNIQTKRNADIIELQNFQRQCLDAELCSQHGEIRES